MPPADPDDPSIATSADAEADSSSEDANNIKSGGGGGGGGSQQSCPICLEPMSPSDTLHPLLCPTQCGYNFCARCVSHLVDRSEDDYEVASDGNRHVKVRLQCPNCRGDLGPTIRSTLVLRRHAAVGDLGDVPDSQLSAAQLRSKHEVDDGELTRARETCEAYAVARVVGAAGEAADTTCNENGEAGTSSSSDGGDVPAAAAPEVKLAIDTTLFAGLECAMTESEQTYVTELMTSGDASNLAQAAQILSGIAELSLKGITPSMRLKKQRQQRSSSSSTSPRTNASAPSPTSTASRQLRSGRSSTYAVGRALAIGRTNNDSETEQAARRREAELARLRRLHPLPVRMPRFATLDAFDPYGPKPRKYPLTFLNDEWDGTIADAFARVQIGRGNQVTHQKRQDEGVSNVIGDADDAIGRGRTNRVVIGVVRGQAGRLGLQKGDVVTHVNGEEFNGTADELVGIVASVWAAEGEGGTFTLVVNAEACTAEALRLRARLLEKGTRKSKEAPPGTMRRMPAAVTREGARGGGGAAGPREIRRRRLPPRMRSRGKADLRGRTSGGRARGAEVIVGSHMGKRRSPPPSPNEPAERE